MLLSAVLFLFLAHLGIGIAWTLLFVSREAGVKFFRFNAGLAAVLIAVALAFRDRAPSPGSVAVDRGFSMRVLTAATFLSSAALLGGACTAMVLGHWYLILPSMPVQHLQSIVK